MVLQNIIIGENWLGIQRISFYYFLHMHGNFEKILIKNKDFFTTTIYKLRILPKLNFMHMGQKYVLISKTRLGKSGR